MKKFAFWTTITKIFLLFTFVFFIQGKKSWAAEDSKTFRFDLYVKKRSGTSILGIGGDQNLTDVNIVVSKWDNNKRAILTGKFITEIESWTIGGQSEFEDCVGEKKCVVEMGITADWDNIIGISVNVQKDRYSPFLEFREKKEGRQIVFKEDESEDVKGSWADSVWEWDIKLKEMAADVKMYAPKQRIMYIGNDSNHPLNQLSYMYDFGGERCGGFFSKFIWNIGSFLKNNTDVDPSDFLDVFDDGIAAIYERKIKHKVEEIQLEDVTLPKELQKAQYIAGRGPDFTLSQSWHDILNLSSGEQVDPGEYQLAAAIYCKRGNPKGFFSGAGSIIINKIINLFTLDNIRATTQETVILCNEGESLPVDAFRLNEIFQNETYGGYDIGNYYKTYGNPSSGLKDCDAAVAQAETDAIQEAELVDDSFQSPEEAAAGDELSALEEALGPFVKILAEIVNFTSWASVAMMDIRLPLVVECPNCVDSNGDIVEGEAQAVVEREIYDGSGEINWSDVEDIVDYQSVPGWVIVPQPMMQALGSFLWMDEGNSLAWTPTFTYTAWRISRDIVNSLFILVVIIMGFFVMFRLQDQDWTDFGRNKYAFKIMFPRFIFSVVLVQFSWIVCWILFDVNNILAFSLEKALGGISFTRGQSGAELGASVVNFLTMGFGRSFLEEHAMADMLIGGVAGTALKTYIAMVFFGIVKPGGIRIPILGETFDKAAQLGVPIVLLMLLGLVSTFMIFIFTVFVRSILLYLLVIISPFVFVLFTFKGFEKTFNGWFKWLMVGLLLYPVSIIVFAISFTMGWSLISPLNNVS